MPSQDPKALFQITYMDADDIADITWAIDHDRHLPTYRLNGRASDGTPVEVVSAFTPAQLRSITAAPYPECLTEANCTHLIDVWNKAGAGQYVYEYLG